MSKRFRYNRAQYKMMGPMKVVNPDAAGIDASSNEHWVSVPEDRSEQPVRKFGTFTEDLNELADWLVSCGVTTVAIEATGVYWVPLLEILEARGLKPRLVDSRSIGRRNKKSDVLDCQWLRQLHTHGLLDAAFRPVDQMMPLRGYMRQRQMLISYASDHIRHMQKALDLMNLKLHLVLSDITGVTGQRIIEEILRGERDPHKLASMREPGCKNSEETIAKALNGNYREEHLFSLRQASTLWKFYRERIAECDQQIEAALRTFEERGPLSQLPSKKQAKKRKNQPGFDARTLLFQMTGVDLTSIPGFEASTILTIISETGIDMSFWPSEGHFSSWLALASNKPISGGKVLPKKLRKIQPNRAAQALRLAAQTLEHAQCALGAFFRRIRSQHGRQAAIKAAAHKLAILFYSMMKSRTPYREPGIDYYEQRYRENLLKSLRRKALSLGFQLIPQQEVH